MASRWLLFDTLTGTLALGAAMTNDNAMDAFQESSDEVLSYAQAYAPWADRTGAARDGLGVEVYEDGGDIYMDLYHTVDYGQWLETIQNGAFAIIMPTLEMYAETIFNNAGGMVFSVEEGD